MRKKAYMRRAARIYLAGKVLYDPSFREYFGMDAQVAIGNAVLPRGFRGKVPEPHRIDHVFKLACGEKL